MLFVNADVILTLFKTLSVKKKHKNYLMCIDDSKAN